RHYAIELEVSPARRTFRGRVTIAARAAAPTREVELHARDLRVVEAVATAGRRRLAGRPRYHPDRETVVLTFAEPLPRGALTLALAFRGRLDPGLRGLYLARDGRERAIVSQCEATDARAIFPCFDEPDLKATLQWTVRAPADLAVITNGAVARRTVDRRRGTQLVVCRRTPKLPTYLAAVTVGPYAATPVRRVAGTPCRVWAAPGALGQAGFALEVTAFVLPWFERYFGQKYHYRKLDQVAVPGFDAGAMENAGAIFYRKNLLLMDPAAASWRQQKAIAETIAHEISHQWFGNRVTMQWWDDLWLNEAFATWIGTKAVDAWRPEWRLWDEFQADRARALAADALVNTRPIYHPVRSPADAVEMFDVITYEKGGAVLRMLERYLGEEPFRRGIQAYMAAYKDANARGADLWARLAEASGEPVGPLMTSWVTQPGFPVVSVELAGPAEAGAAADGRPRLRLTQRRFFADPARAREPNDQRWHVPMVIRYAAGGEVREQRALLVEGSGEVALDASGPLGWLYANADAIGFYRLDPAPPLLEALLTAGLPHLTAAERIALLEDQWALVRNATTDIARFLRVLDAFGAERDFAVVDAVAARLDFLAERLVAEADRPAFARFVARLLGAQLEELGWDPRPGEDEATATRRATVIATLGDAARLPAVLEEAERRQPQEAADPRSVDPNLAGVIVRLAARRGDAARFDAYVATYRARKARQAPPQEANRYLHALAAFEAPALVRRTLELCLEGEVVPQEQLAIMLQQLLQQRAAAAETWAFLKTHWAALEPRLGPLGLNRVIRATTGLPYRLRDDVAAFFAAHPVAEARRALAQALETLDLDEELRRREQARLSAWLAGRAGEGPAAAEPVAPAR
ncbi:MAG TPA: M1 family metallopeptidase, partial [Thermodesulfobacteriota bacterium]|nr:M1 family metallopeptidase [Thermodesulfobacteriota bacterium]